MQSLCTKKERKRGETQRARAPRGASRWRVRGPKRPGKGPTTARSRAVLDLATAQVLTPQHVGNAVRETRLRRPDILEPHISRRYIIGGNPRYQASPPILHRHRGWCRVPSAVHKREGQRWVGTGRSAASHSNRSLAIAAAGKNGNRGPRTPAREAIITVRGRRAGVGVAPPVVYIYEVGNVGRYQIACSIPISV